MEVYLEHLITHSLIYSLIAITLVAFIESLAVVGLILPGTVMMAFLGALIGSGQVGFLPAWGAGIVGCLLGDWISYFLGRVFKRPLHNWSLLQRYRSLLTRTERALHEHSLITVLVGRLIGPTRPLIPMVAGMLNLPVYQFALPNIIGCLIWPPLYFLPGILAGVAIAIPSGSDTIHFKLSLIVTGALAWLAIWLTWRFIKGSQSEKPSRFLTPIRTRWGALAAWVGTALSGIILMHNPLWQVYRDLLIRVFHL